MKNKIKKLLERFLMRLFLVRHYETEIIWYSYAPVSPKVTLTIHDTYSSSCSYWNGKQSNPSFKSMKQYQVSFFGKRKLIKSIVW